MTLNPEQTLRRQIQTGIEIRKIQIITTIYLMLFNVQLIKIARKKFYTQKHLKKGLKFLNDFSEAKYETWAMNQQSKTMAADVIECPICIGEFHEQERIIQLKCHRNHVYHHDCFEELVEQDL